MTDNPQNRSELITHWVNTAAEAVYADRPGTLNDAMRVLKVFAAPALREDDGIRTRFEKAENDEDRLALLVEALNNKGLF